MASEKDRAAVRCYGFGRPARLRSCFIGGVLSYRFPPPTRQATEQMNAKCYCDLVGIGDKSRRNMVYYKVCRQH